MVAWCLGDSIAVGLGPVLPCSTIARVGIVSAEFDGAVGAVDGDLAVISLGSNDGAAGILQHMRAIRSRVYARRVVWIAPAVGNRDAVIQAAASFGDRVVTFTPGPDGIHPTRQGYRDLAASIGR